MTKTRLKEHFLIEDLIDLNFRIDLILTNKLGRSKIPNYLIFNFDLCIPVGLFPLGLINFVFAIENAENFLNIWFNISFPS